MTNIRDALNRLPKGQLDEIGRQLETQNYTLDDVHTIKVFSSPGASGVIPPEAPAGSVIAVAGRGLREYQAFVEGS